MEPLFEDLGTFIGVLLKNPLAPLVVVPVTIIAFACLRRSGNLTRLAVFALTGLSLATLCLFVLLHTQTCNKFDTCRASIHVLAIFKKTLDKVDSATAASTPGSATQNNQWALASNGISTGNFATRCVTTRKTCELLDASGLKAGLPCYCKTAHGFYPGTAR